MVHDVFISHSSKDRSVVEKILESLEDRGFRCWVSWRDIKPGENWAVAIERAIGRSRLMVLVLSGSANHSPDVVREVDSAVDHDLIIIPFRIEAIALNENFMFSLRRRHWLDATGPNTAEHLRKLVSVVRSEIGVASSSEPHPPPQPRRGRGLGWKHMALASGFLMLVAGLGSLILRIAPAASPAVAEVSAVPSVEAPPPESDLAQSVEPPDVALALAPAPRHGTEPARAPASPGAADSTNLDSEVSQLLSDLEAAIESSDLSALAPILGLDADLQRKAFFERKFDRGMPVDVEIALLDLEVVGESGSIRFKQREESGTAVRNYLVRGDLVRRSGGGWQITNSVWQPSDRFR